VIISGDQRRYRVIAGRIERWRLSKQEAIGNG
jgi:hypothetical protein